MNFQNFEKHLLVMVNLPHVMNIVSRTEADGIVIDRLKWCEPSLPYSW